MICYETQGYFDNYNNFYASIGIKGHGGIDIECGYGSDIRCPLEGTVFKVLDDKRPSRDGLGYWGIFMIVNYKGQIGELSIGHCSKIHVDVGQKVFKGQIIGQEGNRGKIFYGATEITKAMQEAGDQRGHHRHWQFRPLRKTKVLDSFNYTSVFGGAPYQDEQGYYYTVKDYDNGYHGLSPKIKDLLLEADVPTEAQKTWIISVLDQLKSVLLSLKLKYGQN